MERKVATIDAPRANLLAENKTKEGSKDILFLDNPGFIGDSESTHASLLSPAHAMTYDSSTRKHRIRSVSSIEGDTRSVSSSSSHRRRSEGRPRRRSRTSVSSTSKLAIDVSRDGDLKMSAGRPEEKRKNEDEKKGQIEGEEGEPRVKSKKDVENAPVHVDAIAVEVEPSVNQRESRPKERIPIIKLELVEPKESEGMEQLNKQIDAIVERNTTAAVCVASFSWISLSFLR